jgi:predicted metal-dependent hydrolase
VRCADPGPFGDDPLSVLPPKLDIGVPYEVRHSTRAKRLQAVVRGGRVEVVVPRRVRPAEVRAFVVTAAPWIVKKAATARRNEETMLPERCVSGATVRFEGQAVELLVEPGAGRRPEVLRGERLVVRLPAPHDRAEERTHVVLLAWLKERAREVAWAHVEHYAPRLGCRPRGLRIKSQRTLWGSCGRSGMINLNWRLIGAPPGVFEYIVVHELCHLRQRNHGPRFWQLVAELMPGHEPHRAWLREHGRELG